MNITELSVHELVEKIENKELTRKEILNAYIDRINKKEDEVKAFVTILDKEALNELDDIQEKIDNGEIKNRLA